MFRKYITKIYLYGTTLFFYFYETLAQNKLGAKRPTSLPTYHPTVNPHLGRHYDVIIVAIITFGIALIAAMALCYCRYRRRIIDSTYIPTTSYGVELPH